MKKEFTAISLSISGVCIQQRAEKMYDETSLTVLLKNQTNLNSVKRVKEYLGVADTLRHHSSFKELSATLS